MKNPKLPQKKLLINKNDATLHFLQGNYGEIGSSSMSSIICLNARVKLFTGVLVGKQIIQKKTGCNPGVPAVVKT